MRLLHRAAAGLALIAACVLAAPSAANTLDLRAFPAAPPLAGGELIPCTPATGTEVAYACTPAQIITLSAASFQPLNTNLTAIAALTTTGFGRSLLTMADAPTTRTAIGAAASGANTDITSITGSAAKWTTARTLAISGDVAWSASLDGSVNVSATATLATVNTNVGSCGGATAIPTLTLDAKGRATACTSTTISFLTPSNNLSDLPSPSTARTNLGLGTASTYSIGTSGATIPLLNGTNTWAAAQVFSAGISASNFSGSNSGTNTGDQTIALSGDVTGSGTGSFAATLAAVNSNVGACGSSTAIPVATYDAKGRATACTTVAIGNAPTATKLAAPVAINKVNFDGSGAITVQGAVSFAQQIDTSGNISVTTTNAVMTGVNDLTVAASAGDILAIEINARANDANPQYILFNAYTVVGSTVTSVLPGASFISGFTMSSAPYYESLDGLYRYVVQSSDIVSGNVTIRLMSYATGARTVAATASNPFVWDVANIGFKR